MQVRLSRPSFTPANKPFVADKTKSVQAGSWSSAKDEEQPVVKQQFVAECQLAAFGYANALRTLKAEYRK
jgi:hypothetical protein